MRKNYVFEVNFKCYSVLRIYFDVKVKIILVELLDNSINTQKVNIKFINIYTKLRTLFNWELDRTLEICEMHSVSFKV